MKVTSLADQTNSISGVLGFVSHLSWDDFMLPCTCGSKSPQTKEAEMKRKQAVSGLVKAASAAGVNDA